MAVQFFISHLDKHSCPASSFTFTPESNNRDVKRLNVSELIQSIRGNKGMHTIQAQPQTELCVPTVKRELRLWRDILDRVVDEGGQVRTHSLRGGEEVVMEPGDIPTTAHYVWCGKKLFKFEDYLGVLSIVKVLRPWKLVFHYNELPNDGYRYHTWFEELSQSLPSLVLQHTDRVLNSNTTDSVNYALEQIAASLTGGVYFGERALLTHIPSQWKSVDYMTYALPGASASEQMIVYARRGITSSDVTFDKFKSDVINASHECVTSDSFNEVVTSQDPKSLETLSPCITLTGPIYPENIINNSSPFGKLARMLYYGKPDIITVQPTQDPSQFIPPISHMIALDLEDNQVVNWTFTNYLSVLSALYIGGFKRVYVHGNQIPTGEWWDRLAQENVKFVYIDRADRVFMNPVRVLAHQSDILRSYILLKYGGVYQDNDVFWTSPPPDHVMRYPAVICYDWPRYAVRPHSINLGIIMARPGAFYLRQFIEHLWYHDDHSWHFNGIHMPYKVYERHPESVLIYTRLQVICARGFCHPTWDEDYLSENKQRNIETFPFSLNDTMTLHFTVPKISSNTTFDTLRRGSDMFSKWGQMLIEKLEKVQQWHLLDRKNESRS
ncbi:hypothetical protein Btru_050827 [Bulinus truncatus]|nr:hypothetical protein Btru_050827 [Bulinus truncatus]